MTNVTSSTYNNVSIQNMVRAKMSDNKITVPVARSIAPFARFKHVKGVPSSQGGYPMSKLRTLNILIDRLKSVKGNRIETPETSRISDKQIDAMIDEYSKKLHQAFAHAKSNPYIAAGSSTGITLSMSV